MEVLRVGTYASQGARKSQEDYVVSDPEKKIFAVFDGHVGSACAQFCAERLIACIVSQRDWELGNTSQALCGALETLERQWIALAKEDDTKRKCGTTATVLHFAKGLATVAQVGDSSAVLCRSGVPVQLAEEHRPTEEHASEVRRVIEAGGKVEPYMKEVISAGCFRAVANKVPVGPPRVWPGGLNITRTLGDFELKNPELGQVPNDSIYLSTPDVETKKAVKGDRWIVMSSDGIYESLSPEIVVELVDGWMAEKIQPDEICKLLVERAIQDGSYDNCCALLLCLRDY